MGTSVVLQQCNVLALLLATTVSSTIHAQTQPKGRTPSTPPTSAQVCSIANMEANLQQPAEVLPNAQNLLVQSPNPDQTFANMERRVPCSTADLLVLGFELKTAYRSGPQDSTNGAFEGVSYLQRGPLLVVCYDEMRLSDRSDSAKVLSTRFACQQIVQPRFRSTGQSAATPRK